MSPSLGILPPFFINQSTMTAQLDLYLSAWHGTPQARTTTKQTLVDLMGLV